MVADQQHGKQHATIWSQRAESIPLTELTSLVRQLVVRQNQPTLAAKVCGICTSVEHPTDMCPTLQEPESKKPESVGAIGGYQYRKQTYQSWPLANQKYGRQPFRPGPSQGPYVAQQFRFVPNVPQGPVVDPAISSTTFPTTAATKIATSRKFSIYGRLDEQPGVPTICELQQHAVPIEYDRHHPRPQDADRTVSQHYELITIGWIQQPSFSNNSESERERKCSYIEKWKRTTSTSTAFAEIN
ncbi:hypothetical protein CR513_41606, partial [Mucuna pruriens]